MVVGELIEGWTSQRSKLDIVRWMAAVQVPCAPVRQLAEVMLDENMHARGSLQWCDHPELGRVVLPHSPIVFGGTSRLAIAPSRPLGSANDEILGVWLGHTPEELDSYRIEGAIS